MREKFENNNGKFYEWLRRQTNKTDGVGDFARHTLWDTEAPKSSDSIDTWTEYCKRRNIPFLVASCRQAWNEFRHVTKKEIL